MSGATCRNMLLVLATFSSALQAGEMISFCPGPHQRYRSPLYQVTSSDGDPAFVSWHENGWKNLPDKDGVTWPYGGMSADNHWVSLSASGEVNLTIRATGIEPEQVELLPERPGNAATVAADGSVRVKLALSDKHPGYYFLRINGGHGDQHPLFIFADPPEQDVPAKGPGVHFFGPGVHDIGPHYAVKGDETVYLAPGALVRGTLTARGANVRVCGRGVLSGELLQEEWIRHKRGFVARPKDARAWGIAPMVWNDAWLGSTTVEGITIIDAPSYNLNLTGRYTVRNVKLLSWNYSTDGVGGTGGPGLVEQCFFKVNDDVFTLYESNRTLRNLVIWKQMNQAVFQLGYGYAKTVKNILVENVEIIRDETETQNGHRGIVVLSASKGCSFSNVRFQDIKVYGDALNLLAIDNLDQDTPWAQKIENVTLREIDLVLERVTVTGTERGRWWGPFADRKEQPMRSRLRTAAPGRIRVRFADVSINGVRLKSEKDFPNGIETQGNVDLTFCATGKRRTASPECERRDDTDHHEKDRSCCAVFSSP